MFLLLIVYFILFLSNLFQLSDYQIQIVELSKFTTIDSLNLSHI